MSELSQQVIDYYDELLLGKIKKFSIKKEDENVDGWQPSGETEENYIDFIYCPNDYSPTYKLLSDGNRKFMKILNIWSGDPEMKGTKEIEIEDHYYEYFQKDIGWKLVLKHRDWLGLKT